MKETLKGSTLYLPFTLLLPHETMLHCKIAGYDINTKLRILINALAIGINLNPWKNLNEFYHERFEDNAIDFNGHNFELKPFGSGRI